MTRIQWMRGLDRELREKIIAIIRLIILKIKYELREGGKAAGYAMRR